jgi:hypothetical protein
MGGGRGTLRLALLLSHPLHDRNWLSSGMAEVLRRCGHEVLPLIPGSRRFARLRRSLRLATMVAGEPKSATYKHKSTLLRGRRRLEAAVWRSLAPRVDLVAWARRVEARLPVPPYILEAVQAARPDLFLWPTMIHMDAWENDWVKAAKTMGVPVLAAPASWDSLTTKSIFTVVPDRLLVWGEASRRHAVELHGFTPEVVAAPGPPHFTPYEQGPIPPGNSVLVAGTSLHYWADEDQMVAQLRAMLPGVEIVHRPHPKKAGWDANVWAVRRALEPAACVVAAFSTVVIEGALLGRPSVLIAFGQGPAGRMLDHERYAHMAEVAHWPSIRIARRLSGLAALIGCALGDSASWCAAHQDERLRKMALDIANCAPGIQERIALAIEAAR